MSSEPRPSGRRAIAGLLFLLIAVVALWVPIYNRVEPTLYGIPFFYWFQTAWILAAAGATAVAYRMGV
jgi:Protein of unknown function (DUF3311)